MPRIQPLVPLLRPLAAPRAPSCQHLFRFSTASRLRAEQNSTTPKPTRSSTTTSSPKPPSNPQEASRAVDLAATEAVTDADSAQPPVQKPTLPSSPSQSSTQSASQSSKSESSAAAGSILSNLSPARYHVARSHNKNLPIYTDYKRGGNLHLTTVRKVTGDTAALRDELRVYLNKDEKDVKINPLNGHIVIKGHHRPEIATFLAARGM